MHKSHTEKKWLETTKLNKRAMSCYCEMVNNMNRCRNGCVASKVSEIISLLSCALNIEKISAEVSYAIWNTTVKKNMDQLLSLEEKNENSQRTNKYSP